MAGVLERCSKAVQAANSGGANGDPLSLRMASGMPCTWNRRQNRGLIPHSNPLMRLPMQATSTESPSVARPATTTTRTNDRPIARWIVAVIAIMYGFAKLNGSQFTVLDSELDKPMGAVSGFWLTWYYFSYSPVYGNLIAAIQVAGGLLLYIVLPHAKRLLDAVLLPRTEGSGGLRSLVAPAALVIAAFGLTYRVANLQQPRTDRHRRCLDSGRRVRHRNS